MPAALGRTAQIGDATMLHEMILAAQSQPEAAGFILRGIKGIFVAIGSIIAAIICAIIAGTKGRSAILWGILGLFFSILTLIVVIIIPSKKS
jgi:ATP/ADP translocase